MPALLPGFLPRGPFDNQRHIWYNTWLPGHAGILLAVRLTIRLMNGGKKK